MYNNFAPGSIAVNELIIRFAIVVVTYAADPWIILFLQP